MSPSLKTLLTILLTLTTLFLTSKTANSRPITTTMHNYNNIYKNPKNPNDNNYNHTTESINSVTLATRLNLDDDNSSTSCWDSLFKVQACTGEVIQFFYNGEAYMGPQCCHAIFVIVHDCWPTMLTSLGFTSEETDVLRGYCDAEEALNGPGPSPPHADGPTKAEMVIMDQD